MARASKRITFVSTTILRSHRPGIVIELKALLRHYSSAIQGFWLDSTHEAGNLQVSGVGLQDTADRFNEADEVVESFVFYASLNKVGPGAEGDFVVHAPDV